MKKYLDIHGKYIYTQKGKKIGYIENAIFNYKMKRITSYIISNGRIIPKNFLIPLNRINYIKNKMIISEPITSYKKRLINKNICFTIEGIIEKPIFNKDNRFIGEVEDIILDDTSGCLKAIICKRGFFDDLIRGKKVLLINNIIITKDKIICSEGSIEIINELSFKSDFKEIN